jgi:ParB family transcriptional regulator, chromosome partitioning protein
MELDTNKLKPKAKRRGGMPIESTGNEADEMFDLNIEIKDGIFENINANKIFRNPKQPRDSFNNIDDLSISIKNNGIIEPIVVRQKKDSKDSFEIIAGERRWRAAKKAGVDIIPCIIRVMSDKEALVVGIVENIEREELNIIEEAKSYLRLKNEFEMSQADIARSVSKSSSQISNILRILNLNDSVIKMISANDLTFGHAKVLCSVCSSLKQLEYANLVLNKELSVHQLESYIARDEKTSSKKTHSKDPNVESCESDLSKKLGCKVNIFSKKNGSGKVTFFYSSNDELEGIMDHIK